MTVHFKGEITRQVGHWEIVLREGYLMCLTCAIWGPGIMYLGERGD